jgi:DNA ligase-1
MLATDADFDTLKFPCYGSPKLDGVRALVKDGVVLARSLKPIPNDHVQKLFGRPELEGLDGELIVGSPTDKDCFQNTSGAVRRKSGEPSVRFFVFDKHDETTPFNWRKVAVEKVVGIGPAAFVVPLRQVLILSLADLSVYEDHLLEEGYEGVILRAPKSPYKFGRSTAKEGYLLKVKRFEDSEARILAVEELMHNANEAKTNELGRTERSSHKAGLVPAGTMGRLYVEDIHTGQRFHIGTGFTAEQRAWWWAHRHPDDRLDLRIKYKFFPVGVKDLPRHPVYLGLRDEFDMGC